MPTLLWLRMTLLVTFQHFLENSYPTLPIPSYFLLVFERISRTIFWQKWAFPSLPVATPLHARDGWSILLFSKWFSAVSHDQYYSRRGNGCLQKGGMIGSEELITCKNRHTADRFQAMLLRCASAESEKNGGLGAKPPENFLGQHPSDRWKMPSKTVRLYEGRSKSFRMWEKYNGRI